jgi:perosamine synthetase
MLADLRREYRVLTQVHYIPVPAQPYYADCGAEVRQLPRALAYYEGS